MIVTMTNPSKDDLVKTIAEIIDSAPNVSELARAVGVSRSTLYLWRRGDALPDLEKLERLASATSSSITFHLGDDVPLPPDAISEIIDRLDELTSIVRDSQRRLDILESGHS
jgi:transcriptional regulator with XRE-family HTH domain